MLSERLPRRDYRRFVLALLIGLAGAGGLFTEIQRAR
jgi:hypothetical protein